MPWILISILVLIILLAVVAIILNRKREHKPDYFSFFTIGVIWFIFGLPLKSYTFSAMGLIFMIIGLANKDKWKENRRTWKNMDKNERIFYLIVTTTLGVLVLAGLIAWLLTTKGII